MIADMDMPNSRFPKLACKKAIRFPDKIGVSGVKGKSCARILFGNVQHGFVWRYAAGNIFNQKLYRSLITDFKQRFQKVDAFLQMLSVKSAVPKMKYRRVNTQGLRDIGICGQQTQALLAILLIAESEQKCKVFLKMHRIYRERASLQRLVQTRQIVVVRLQHHQFIPVRRNFPTVTVNQGMIKAVGFAYDRSSGA